MSSWIRRLTLEQWQKIDDEQRSEPQATGRAALVLVTVAVSLAINRFGGGRAVGMRHAPQVSALLGITDLELCGWLYWSAFKLVSYGLLPVLCIRFVLKGRVRDYGLRFVKEPDVWLLYTAMMLLVVPLAYVVSHTGPFLQTYPKYRAAGDSLPHLLLWEAAYAFQFLMLEFFFRGFLVFALARVIGHLAIFVMVVPYCMIHFDKPLLECLGAIITGIVLGTVSLRTRSIYGGVIVHSVVAWSMDLFALLNTGKLMGLWD